MKIIVWGTGGVANEYVCRKAYHRYDEIIAFVDNNRNLWGQKYKDGHIIAPDELRYKQFDRLVICTHRHEEVRRQIEELLNIDSSKVITYFELEEEIKTDIINKYINSNDTEIQKVIEFYGENPLNIFGYYHNEDEEIYPVMHESDGMPYIWFENKKMYYPRGYHFDIEENGRKVVRNIMYEQGKGSPHRYIRSEDFTGDNQVIVDAGVCEGNFALRYVEKAKKIYLVEPDNRWVEALHRTFLPYQRKVVFCKKFLSGKDSETDITLDTLVNEKIDFLKMDIEGYEREALRGADRVLTESDVHCAICSYHNHGDEKAIRGILEKHGYRTEVSEGYMFFPYDVEVEFRKGVVYGRKF